MDLFNYLSIIIADQNNSFHGQVGSVIGQISIGLFQKKSKQMGIKEILSGISGDKLKTI